MVSLMRRSQKAISPEQHDKENSEKCRDREKVEVLAGEREFRERDDRWQLRWRPGDTRDTREPRQFDRDRRRYVSFAMPIHLRELYRFRRETDDSHPLICRTLIIPRKTALRLATVEATENSHLHDERRQGLKTFPAGTVGPTSPSTRHRCPFLSSLCPLQAIRLNHPVNNLHRRVRSSASFSF